MVAERKLIVRYGEQVREVLLVGTVSVGRNPSCEISEADPLLSREHAEFRTSGNDVLVRDLGSRNGTRVNGRPVKEQKLAPGDRIEVGPFVIEYASVSGEVDVDPGSSDNEATVVLPKRAPVAGAKAAAPVPPAVGHVPPSPPLARSTPAVAAVAPRAEAPRPKSSAPGRPPAAVEPAPSKTPVAAGAAGAAATPFGRAVVLRVVAIALLSCVLGLLPMLFETDVRGPLFDAQFKSLARTSTVLVSQAPAPTMSLDDVVAALRGYVGVTQVRILGGDGRVLAPTGEGGTLVEVPALEPGQMKVTDAEVGVRAIWQSAKTADGRAVVVRLAVDPARILAPPGNSPVGPIFVLAGMAAAWLMARHLVRMTDARLSRLGEEIELMATGQTPVGRDPFVLKGGQRVIDAATFLVAQVRVGGKDDQRGLGRANGQQAVADDAGLALEACLTADAGFRVLDADAGCRSLLGLDPGTAPGTHLIDAVRDRHVADEVLRLVSLATPGRPAQGAATPEGGTFQLSIEVVRGGNDTPIAIRFRRT